MGKHLSEEHKRKLSLARIGKHYPNRSIAITGAGNPMFGRKHSEDTKEKISAWARTNQFGENNPNWNGGKSFEPYSPTFNKKLKEQIKQRDNYKCRECGLTGKYLQVHHIDYQKWNNNPDNLITLCVQHHLQTNFDRLDWINHFKEKMQNRKL